MSIATTAFESLTDQSKALAQKEPCNPQLRTSVLSPYSIVEGGRVNSSTSRGRYGLTESVLTPSW